MATLTIDKKGPPSQVFKLIRPGGDPEPVAFDADGKATVPLTQAGHHDLDWTVRGPKGTKFSHTVALDGAAVEVITDAEISAAQSEMGHIDLEVKS